MNIRYSPKSITDLKRLRAFIEPKSKTAAQRVSSGLIERIDKLKVFPNMGVPVTSAPNQEVIRDLLLNSYTIRYLVTKSNIYILRIWHDKENERSL